jgi:hypothetical protein
MSLANVVCCQVEVFASKRSPTECRVSEYDREASLMKKLWPSWGCSAMGGKK